MWLILETELERVEAAYASFLLHPDVEKREASAPHPMVMSHGTANIHISGILLPKRDAMLDMFGIEQTSYLDIRAQIAQAKAGGAKRARFHMNTPGGNVDGMYETMEAIAGMGIPTETIAGAMLASAGYMLASQTGKIIAQTEMSAIGSVGMVITKSTGGDRKEITNTSSRKKKPDISTPEGVAVVEEELQDFFQIVAEKVSTGRGVDIETVKTKYGEGATMSARTALSIKMIDAIEKKQPAAKPAATKGAIMDLETLRAEHPEAYKAAFEAGIKAEHGRVTSHLILASASGEVKLAHECIENGSDVSSEINAKHHAAAINKAKIGARADENVGDLGAGTAAKNDQSAGGSKTEIEQKFSERYGKSGWSIKIREDGGDQ